MGTEEEMTAYTSKSKNLTILSERGILVPTLGEGRYDE